MLPLYCYIVTPAAMRSLWGMGRHPPFLLAFKKMRKKKGGLPIPQRGIGASTLFIPFIYPQRKTILWPLEVAAVTVDDPEPWPIRDVTVMVAFDPGMLPTKRMALNAFRSTPSASPDDSAGVFLPSSPLRVRLLALAAPVQR